MKKLIVLTLLAGMILTMLAGCGSREPNTTPGVNEPTETDSATTSDEVYTLVLATDAKDDHPYSISAFYFADLCKEYSDGRLIIDVKNNGVLSTSEREMFESLQLGNYDMCVATTSPLTNFDPSFAIFDMPFLFESKDHAYAALDGEFGQQKNEGLIETAGIRILGWWECGMFNFIYNGNPISKPEDLKGRTIRCMETTTTMTWLSAMGANPVPMAFGEVYTSLQQNTIDGTLLPYSTSYYQGIYEVTDHYSIMNITYCPLALAISEVSYQNLPSDLQEVIVKAGIESTEFNREYTAGVEDECLAGMNDGGCEVDYVTDENRALWVDAIQVAYDQLIPSLFSQEEVDMVKSFA